MSAPSVTYSFTNGTTSDATQVNTNFTDLINGASDGTRDYTIGTLVVNGAVSLKGTVTLGDSTSDDLTFTGSIASTIPYKTNATYNIGAATLAPLSVYLGNGTKSTRIMAGTVGTSWTFTLPNDVPAVTGRVMIFNTSGTAEFRYPDKAVAAQTAAYTATGDETIIPCTPAASFDLTLPDVATHTGKTLQIYRTDNDLSKVVTIKNAGGDTIAKVHIQNERVWITSDGTSWAVSNRYIPGTFFSYTPTMVGFGTPTSVSFEWMRIGSSILIIGGFTSGTNTSTEAQVPLPVGLTCAHALSTAIAVGTFGYNGNLAGSRLMLATSGDAFLNISTVSSSANGLTARNGNDFGNTTAATVWAQLRVTEWT